nr:hypothetical protein [uncultured Desulfobacter sp.]
MGRSIIESLDEFSYRTVLAYSKACITFKNIKLLLRTEPCRDDKPGTTMPATKQLGLKKLVFVKKKIFFLTILPHLYFCED